MNTDEVITVKVFDSKREIRDAEVFYKFDYEGRWYCAVTTTEEPYETQVLGYGYDEEGRFFTYDIAEPLYGNVLDLFKSVHLPGIVGEADDNAAPIINVQGIGRESHMTKQGQALMFFDHGLVEDKKHSYVLVAYIEPEVKEHRGGFYRYEFVELENGEKAIVTEPIRNDMEYESVRAYFKKEKGEELRKLLVADKIDLRY
ncbi:MAG: DUF1292 domain-containing protein [Butyrivibrio sp.]|nr:DUF1292 domain-containing protein [Butyrivibrio sp.]